MICLLSLGNRLGTVNPGLSPDWIGPLSGRTAGGLRLGGRLGLCVQWCLGRSWSGRRPGPSSRSQWGGWDPSPTAPLRSLHPYPAQSGRESGPVRPRYPAQSGRGIWPSQAENPAQSGRESGPVRPRIRPSQAEVSGQSGRVSGPVRPSIRPSQAENPAQSGRVSGPVRRRIRHSQAKQSKAKFKAFFSLFSLFSLFFRFFHFFSLNFCFALIFSHNFRLFYLRFRFRFLVFRIEVNHVKSGFFSHPSETKFSLQFQISLPKRK
jgi:hypothetical protein